VINLVKRNLAGRDLKDVLLVSRTALGCTRVNELREEVLRLLEDIFGTENSNFFVCSSSDQKVNLDQVVTRGVGNKYLKSFQQFYYKLDPFYKHAFPLTADVVTNEQVIPFKDFVNSEYYNDFLRHQSIHYEMVFYLKSRSRRLGVIALFRPPRSTNFSEEELTKAKLMAPYLAGALEKTIISEECVKTKGIIKTITSDIPDKGIIILDEALEPVYQNEEALKISSLLCDADKSNDKSIGGLPKELYLSCQRLKHLVQPKEPIPPCREFNHVLHAGEQQILVRLHLMAGGEKSPLLMIYLELNKPPVLLSQSRNQFGLTRREIEVINLLALGLKNTEIAAKLFISEHTVENHLKSIYQKLDVRNRTSLVHRLTHLSWPRPGGTNGSNGF
jgi:DNA-binding CsgD family transcriptional regulator